MGCCSHKTPTLMQCHGGLSSLMSCLLVLYWIDSPQPLLRSRRAAAQCPLSRVWSSGTWHPRISERSPHVGGRIWSVCKQTVSCSLSLCISLSLHRQSHLRLPRGISLWSFTWPAKWALNQRCSAGFASGPRFILDTKWRPNITPNTKK